MSQPIDEDEELTVLMVGDGEPLSDGLVSALERRNLAVHRHPVAGSVHIAIATAPDLVLLVGDAANTGGGEVLAQLGASPLASVVPVVLLSDEELGLDQRLRAFRFGATAVVPRSASVDAIAEKVSALAREIPERSSTSSGELGEATLEDFASMLATELRAGILSVKNHGREDTAVRIVLGEGRTVADVVESFVDKVRPLVRSAEVVRYEFQEHAGGTLSLLGPEGTEDHEPPGEVRGMRVLLADDDVTRGDAVAQELRSRGADVVLTDLSGNRMDRARQLDPGVLVIGETAMGGDGYRLVQTMQEDVRLRWAYLLVVSWDEIWSEKARGPVVTQLVQRLSKLREAERSLHVLAKSGKPFDVRMEATGPSRLLRALVSSEEPLRLTVQRDRIHAQIDLRDGLIAGAIGALPDKDQRLEGAVALAAFLGLATGRVKVERVDSPASANLMSTLDVALDLAANETSPLRPSVAPSSASLPPLVGSATIAREDKKRDETLHGLPVPKAPRRPGPITFDLESKPTQVREPKLKAPVLTPPLSKPKSNFKPPPPKMMLRGFGKTTKPLPVAGGRTKDTRLPAKPKPKAKREPTLIGMPAPRIAEDTGTEELVAPPTNVAATAPMKASPAQPQEPPTREVPLPEPAEPAIEATVVTAAPDAPPERSTPEPPAPAPAAEAEPPAAFDSEAPTAVRDAPVFDHVPAPPAVPRALPIAPTPAREEDALDGSDTVIQVPDAGERADDPLASPTLHLGDEHDADGIDVNLVPSSVHIDASVAAPNRAIDTHHVRLDALPGADELPSAVDTAALPAQSETLLPAAKRGPGKLAVIVGLSACLVLGLGVGAIVISMGDEGDPVTDATDPPEVASGDDTEPRTEFGQPTTDLDPDGTDVADPEDSGLETIAADGPDAGAADELDAVDAGADDALADDALADSEEEPEDAEEEPEDAEEEPEDAETLADGELPPGVELPETPSRVERMPERRRQGFAQRFRRLGDRALRQRRYAQAESLFMRALEYDSGDAKAVAGVALARFRNGDRRLGLTWLRYALQLDPEDADLHVLLGDGLGSEGDLEGARSAWQEAVRLDPHHRAARRRLARLD